ncbi:MAG: hypothetical protein JO227_16245 [Acetobacteraceae bacterium]|nr:hypothetical protein [Acetobacteraceae bacterium]
MIENRTVHDINCEWQLDQYDFECTCGMTRPRAPWFIPFEGERAERIWLITQSIAGGSAA